jgi:hypothetical protein
VWFDDDATSCPDKAEKKAEMNVLTKLQQYDSMMTSLRHQRAEEHDVVVQQPRERESNTRRTMRVDGRRGQTFDAFDP